jgi:hypothetical protein
MRLTIAYIFFIIAIALQSVQILAKVAVGLYAPDRYEGVPEMCLMPMDFGYCRAKVKRYYFDMRRMKCNMFFWGGCAGNNNNFESLEECTRLCVHDINDLYYNTNKNNVNEPPTYTANSGRKTLTKTNNNNANNNNNNNNNNEKTLKLNNTILNTSIYNTNPNSNLNKFKINRNFNIPKNNNNNNRYFNNNNNRNNNRDDFVDDGDDEEDIEYENEN